MTLENDAYKTDWKKCTRCGLIAPDVGVPEQIPLAQTSTCPTSLRCSRVINGEPLGGLFLVGEYPKA